jgi:hypothetical protein
VIVVIVTVILVKEPSKEKSDISPYFPNSICENFKIIKISEEGMFDYSEESIMIPRNPESIEIFNKWYQSLDENLNKSHSHLEPALKLIYSYSKIDQKGFEPTVCDNKVIRQGVYIDVVYDKRNVVYVSIWQD